MQEKVGTKTRGTNHFSRLTSVLAPVIFQALSRSHWTSGSSWSGCLSSAGAQTSQSRSQVWTGTVGPTARQTAEERPAWRTWPWCWLGKPDLTELWMSWRNVACSWSCPLNPNWSVSYWGSRRRGRGGSGRMKGHVADRVSFRHLFIIKKNVNIPNINA